MVIGIYNHANSTGGDECWSDGALSMQGDPVDPGRSVLLTAKAMRRESGTGHIKSEACSTARSEMEVSWRNDNRCSGTISLSKYMPRPGCLALYSRSKRIRELIYLHPGAGISLSILRRLPPLPPNRTHTRPSMQYIGEYASYKALGGIRRTSPLPACFV